MGRKGSTALIDKGLEKGLTPVEVAFCKEYISNGLNGTAAYRDVVASENSTYATIGIMASKWLRKDHIKTYIQNLIEEAGLSDNHLDLQLARLVYNDDPNVRLKAIKLAKTLNGRLDKSLRIRTDNGAVVFVGNTLLSDD